MKKILNLKSLFPPFIILLIAGLSATTAYYYNGYQKIKKNPDLIAQEEVKVVVDKIHKYMELPSDEQPTIATITDQEKLKDQAFFKNAQNGDKVLIYAKAAKAILYRPSTSRVIEFAPLILDASQGVQTAKEATTVVIANGTEISGITSDYEKTITSIANTKVISKIVAAKKDYTENTVVLINEKALDIAKQISEKIDGRFTTTVPDGETTPNADIFVIIGKNR